MTAGPLSSDERLPSDEQLPPHLDRHTPVAADRYDPYRAMTLAIIQVAIVLAGFDLEIKLGVSASLVVVAAMAPVWWREVAAYSLAIPILALTGGAIVSGLYLAELSSADHVISRSLQVTSITHLLNGLGIMVAVLWGRSHFPLHRVAVLYGAGAVADALLNTSQSWKFHLAVPVTIIVIGWMGKFRNQLPTVAALLGLAALGVLDEGRSYAAFCIAAAGAVMWQSRPSGLPTRRWYPAAVLAAFAAAIYWIASSLLTRGYFGPELQQRSTAQIDATGSLIAGGRPEWAATQALIRYRPRGYGVGTIPDLVDHNLAENGLASINVRTGGYLTNYMMGGQFRLHSVAADLWVSYGVVGAVLAGVIVFAIVRNVSVLLADRRAPALVVFMSVLALWHMAFGPIWSNWPDVCFALGVVLLHRRNAPAASDEATRRDRSNPVPA